MEEPLPAPTDSPRAAARLRRAAAERPSLLPEKSGEKAAEDGSKAAAELRTASLAAALRRARVESAEHSAAVADVRTAEMGRLEILADALAPVLLQVPADCDIFDVAIAPGERPRLFIDQIGFVEVDRDRRAYRFLQDTRHGRITLRETADVDDMVDAVTDYIAHRLIEREKALAIDYASGGVAKLRAPAPDKPRKAASGGGEPAFRAFLFVVETIGAAAFFGLLAVIAAFVYRTYLAG
jgi:hypothetical protein